MEALGGLLGRLGDEAWVLEETATSDILRFRPSAARLDQLLEQNVISIAERSLLENIPEIVTFQGGIDAEGLESFQKSLDENLRSWQRQEHQAFLQKLGQVTGNFKEDFLDTIDVYEQQRGNPDVAEALVGTFEQVWPQQTSLEAAMENAWINGQSTAELEQRTLDIYQQAQKIPQELQGSDPAQIQASIDKLNALGKELSELWEL